MLVVDRGVRRDRIDALDLIGDDPTQVGISPRSARLAGFHKAERTNALAQ